MEITNTLKNKVRNAVSLYKQSFRDEYRLVITQIADYRKNLKTDFAEVEVGHKDHALKRELFRIPEKLYHLLMSNLIEDELKMLDEKEYSKWFMSEYPEFKVTSNY